MAEQTSVASGLGSLGLGKLNRYFALFELNALRELQIAEAVLLKQILELAVFHDSLIAIAVVDQFQSE